MGDAKRTPGCFGLITVGILALVALGICSGLPEAYYLFVLGVWVFLLVVWLLGMGMGKMQSIESRPRPARASKPAPVQTKKDLLAEAKRRKQVNVEIIRAAGMKEEATQEALNQLEEAYQYWVTQILQS